MSPGCFCIPVLKSPYERILPDRGHRGCGTECPYTTHDQATVLGLTGEMGAGKTTLAQAIARSLGVADTVVSPTFVIAKFYEATKGSFKALVHIDAYRIDSLDELGPIGFEDILAQPETLVIIEWPERIDAALPDQAVRLQIDHDEDKRTIHNI